MFVIGFAAGVCFFVVGFLFFEDYDFDFIVEMLVYDYDDERILEEEELMDDGKNFSFEIEDLEKVKVFCSIRIFIFW